MHVGLKPLLVGMVHGAAGSAALMLLVLSTIHSPLEAFLYILVFGFGSVAGMLAISVLLALPLHWAKEKAATSYRPIQLTAGLFSCLFGLYLGIEIWSSMPR
jgi:sulfite exporter TauE/SafE